MARPTNPLGDPVRVQLHNGWLQIRFYPTGIITKANERQWLPGGWSPNDPTEVEAAHAAADELRQKLMAHRAAHGITTPGAHCNVIIAKAVDAYIQSLITARTPPGTVNTRHPQLKRMLVTPHGSEPIERLRGLAESIVHRVNTEPKRNGQPKKQRTIDGSTAALWGFGQWAAKTYHIVDPFEGKLAPTAYATTAFREASWAMIHSDNPFEDGDEEESIDPDKLPTLLAVNGLRDAIIRRETGRMPWHKAEGRGSKGGPRLLGVDAATQLALSPRFIASTGVRGMECLAVHTSRVDLATMRLAVDRQLDRHQLWLPGQHPPLCPPKGGHKRTVSIWPEFKEELSGLIDYADEHTDGWLFAPSRGQTWWAEGYANMINRARKLLRIEYAQLEIAGGAPPRSDVFDTGIHWLRHLYASHSLAPTAAGGLGWSISFVQHQLGHTTRRTTELIYLHIIQPERELARYTPHTWPGDATPRAHSTGGASRR